MLAGCSSSSAATTTPRWGLSGRERLAKVLVTEHTLAMRLRSHVLQTLVRDGRKRSAFDRPWPGWTGWRPTAQRCARPLRYSGSPSRSQASDGGARAGIDGPLAGERSLWIVRLGAEAIARDALGDRGAQARPRARPDLAKPESLLSVLL